jgi:hypothetical protein
MKARVFDARDTVDLMFCNWGNLAQPGATWRRLLNISSPAKRSKRVKHIKSVLQAWQQSEVFSVNYHAYGSS